MKKLSKEKKKELVSKLTDDIKESNINLLVGFSGLSVMDMQGLRSDLSELGCSMKVVKNTLLEKTYGNINHEESCKGLTGSVFIVWTKGNDEIGVLKKLLLFKQKTEKINFKTGIINNRVFNEAELSRLSALPLRKQIEASVVFNLRMPLLRIINSVRFPAARLISNLNQISDNKKEK
ncbi:MAG TPA: 50S ribosomal protein L10 [bacterium]|nr:50S ribosomal protein L10 [bacterium]